MNKNSLSLILLFTLIGAFIVVWDLPPGTFIEPKDATQAKRFPSTYFSNLHTKEFNEDGFINFELNAEMAEIFGSTGDKTQNTKPNGVTRFTKPVLQFHTPDHPTWFSKSNVGISNNNGEKLELHNNVNVWYTNKLGKQIRIKTASLIIFPKREYAETDKPVTITSPEGKTEAVGMKLFINEQRLQLLNKVKGYYEPI